MNQVNFYNMELEEIEKALGISKYDANRHTKVNSKILDDWDAVAIHLNYLEGLNDWNRHVSVLGYEIYEEHYIKLHYRTYVSFT